MTIDADLSRATAAVTVPRCPDCAADLVLGGDPSVNGPGWFDHWSCPAGHGLAMTLSESYERLQSDEIGQIWSRARAAAPGSRPSPFTGTPMAQVTIGADADEAPEGDAGDGATTATVVVDVDVDNQFIWLDAGELDEFPEDLPDAPVPAEVLATEHEIVARFGQAYEDAVEDRESRELTERLYRRVARHPGALRALDSIGRGLTAY